MSADAHQGRSDVSLTVAIPVYNEEEILRQNTLRLVAILREHFQTFELLIGSNGSTDRTVAIGQQLAREIPEVSFFHLPDRGVGAAFREFLALARFDLLVSLDMDLAVDLGFVDDAVRRLAHADIVVGSKHTGQERRSRFRQLGSRVFVQLAALLLHIRFDDFSIGAKAYRIASIRPYASLISRGSSYVLDLVYYIHRDGGRVEQIPVSCEDYRASRFNLGHEAVHKFTRLGRLWWRRRRRVQQASSAH